LHSAREKLSNDIWKSKNGLMDQKLKKIKDTLRKLESKEKLPKGKGSSQKAIGGVSGTGLWFIGGSWC